ncbi:MAG: redoxin domain-containing protein [Saprospiraceae bacterium]|nr:redoxin domain-containing protein [Saprospiraceae bacterium]MBK7812172.1 redoxin domain-containing protein [Saprospiraceae bacterium]MBK9632611.1 redoxin domain-containing protein [Saprospiraceae bacterium]
MSKIQERIRNLQTHSGKSILEISKYKQVLLVFLRHFGCTFCREALEEIRELEKKLNPNQVSIVLVHMAEPSIAMSYFEKFKISHLEHISDPDCQLYQDFGLLKGRFNQLFGFRSWIRGVDAGIIKGHGWGVQLGDGFQMPGVFSIFDGKITSEFRHSYASDKPDYMSMISCLSL